jgi:hypothetical protein
VRWFSFYIKKKISITNVGTLFEMYSDFTTREFCEVKSGKRRCNVNNYDLTIKPSIRTDFPQDCFTTPSPQLRLSDGEYWRDQHMSADVSRNSESISNLSVFDDVSSPNVFIEEEHHWLDSSNLLRNTEKLDDACDRHLVNIVGKELRCCLEHTRIIALKIMDNTEKNLLLMSGRQDGVNDRDGIQSKKYAQEVIMSLVEAEDVLSKGSMFLSRSLARLALSRSC